MVREIPLNKGQVALVDDDRYEDLSRYKWRIYGKTGRTWYAMQSEQGRSILMHRVILGVEPGLEVDHINGNGLDNRRQNLRACTRAQNSGNQRPRTRRGGNLTSSRFKGIHWESDRNRWHAVCRCDNRIYDLGRYSIEEDAADAYDRAAQRLYGEFARLNHART